MVYAFTETEKKKIEKMGIMVIQFKRELRRRERTIDAWRKLVRWANNVVDKLRELADKVCQIFDEVRYTIEELVFYAQGRNGSRYKMVRTISKCTGIERHCIWKMTRPAYLARNHC